MTTPPALRKQAVKTAAATKKAVAERDRIIHQLRDAGETLRSIGELMDLSHTAIANILKKETDSDNG